MSADRILIWTPTTHDAVFCLDADYSPDFLTLYAGDAPTLGDLVVDILDDDVSIMQGGNITVNTMTKTNGEIYYGTYSGTFQVAEEITGGTSSATADILEVYPGKLVVEHTTPSTSFTVSETITGGTSAATGTVDSWVAPQEYYTPSTTPRSSNARLEQGENLNEEAEDFGRERPLMVKGSLVKLSILEYGGANKIQVELGLEKVN